MQSKISALFSNAKRINGTDKWGWCIKLSPLSVAISISAIICGTWIYSITKTEKRKGNREKERGGTVAYTGGSAKGSDMCLLCLPGLGCCSETDGEQTCTQADIHRRTL